MPYVLVVPIIDHSVRQLCTQAYALHKNGCPNYQRKKGCPPGAPYVEDLLDLSRPVYAVYNRFDLGTHVLKMRAAHPRWSERQAKCCLYWQPTARSRLAIELYSFLGAEEYDGRDGTAVLKCPEANGVNVTATMAAAGIRLEWPPKQYAYQVVLVGRAKQPSTRET